LWRSISRLKGAGYVRVRVHGVGKVATWRRWGARTAAASAGLLVAGSIAVADTLEWALAQTYQNNPQLNAQRAAVRVTDENVPQALSGYRPRLSATASIAEQYLDIKSRVPLDSGGAVYTNSRGTTAVQTYGGTLTQTLFNGYQTANRTRQAESQVSGARETLRLTEQTVLLAGVTAYMNLLRDAAILELQRRNVEVLQEGLRQTRDRFNVGEVTRTDVAQAE
jgi:outer membrane protein